MFMGATGSRLKTAEFFTNLGDHAFCKVLGLRTLWLNSVSTDDIEMSVFFMPSIAGKMASSQYGVTLKQLRDLMELRGKEAVDKLQEVGGSQGLCKKLKTSEANGKDRKNKKGRRGGEV